MKEVYTNAIGATSRDEYLKGVAEGNPRSYVIYHDKILAFADRKFPVLAPDYTAPHTEFRDLPEEVTQWVTEELPKRNRPKTLVIWGPSRTGKTSWARSLVRGYFIYYQAF